MDQSKEEEFQHDWYGILGCEVGTIKEEIERAARKLAVKYHPDKTTDPDAPAKFLLVQKAKEILTDDVKKKKIDDYYAATKKRQEYEQVRNKSMDVSRKRFRDQLDSKIQKESDKQQSSKENMNDILEREVKKRSKIIENLKKQNQKMMEESMNELNAKLNAKNASFKAYTQNLQETLKIKKYPIKIRWRRSDISHSEESLYQLFKAFGPIETISTESTSGTSAVITFVDEEAARNAIEYFATSEQYRVKGMYEEKEKKRAAVFTHQYTTNNSVNNVLQEEVNKRKDIYELQRDIQAEENEFVQRLLRKSSLSVTEFEAKEQRVLQRLIDLAQEREKQHQEEEGKEGRRSEVVVE